MQKVTVTVIHKGKTYATEIPVSPRGTVYAANARPALEAQGLPKGFIGHCQVSYTANSEQRTAYEKQLNPRKFHPFSKFIDQRAKPSFRSSKHG